MGHLSGLNFICPTAITCFKNSQALVHIVNLTVGDRSLAVESPENSVSSAVKTMQEKGVQFVNSKNVNAGTSGGSKAA